MGLGERLLLACASLVAAACSFDENGLQTSSNSAGTLESSGTDGSSDSNGSTSPTTTATTASTSNGSASTTTSESDPSTTMTVSTTEPATETTDPDTGTSDPTTTAGSTGESQGTTSEGGVESTETGLPFDPYGDCDGSEDCNGGTCVTLYLDWAEEEVCYPPCEMQSDCPVPSTGTAAPICTQSGCGLDCDNGLTCPDGMQCGYNGNGGRRCLWQ